MGKRKEIKKKRENQKRLFVQNSITVVQGNRISENHIGESSASGGSIHIDQIKAFF